MSAVKTALGRLARSEQGLSVPVALIMIVVGLGLASAAIMASIAAQNGSTRDQRSKDALAAADAGAQLAIYRQDKIVTTDLAKCVVPLVGGALGASSLVGSDGWCPQVESTTADGLPTGTSFKYRVQPWTVVWTTQTGVKRQLQIVVVGTSDGISRRIDVTASARTGQGIYGGKGAIGQDRVTIGGSSDVGTTTAVTNVGTGGDIFLEGSANLCGDAFYGTGHSLQVSGSATQCPGHSSFENQLSLPAVDPLDAWNSNSNSRICVEDSATPPSACNSNGDDKVSWDPLTRTLDLSGKATLNLGGSLPYSLCSLQMSGSSKIFVANTAGVTIMFASPEQCQMTGDPVTQLQMTGNPRLSTTSQDPGALKLLFVGSKSIPTAISMTGNPATHSADDNTFTLYAPLSDVTLQGSATYLGAVAGKTLTVDGGATLIQRDSATNSDIPVVTSYLRERYVECAGGTMPMGTGAHPNDSC
jgi:hypothetical protein